MKVTQCTIRAGRVIQHPTMSYSNVKTEVELVATVDDDEVADAVITNLRVRAEQIVHTHQEQVCESIRKGVEIETTTGRIEQLEAELAILKERQKSHQGLLFGTTEVNERDDDLF